MLEELVVGILNKESVRFSCHLLPAFYKLDKLSMSIGDIMAKLSFRLFDKVQIATTMSVVEKEKFFSGSGVTVLGIEGATTLGSVRS